MPCTPGMTACKASCAHRAMVESYRSERSRQISEVAEQAKGYDTEIADIEQQRRDASPRGRAYPLFQDWLIDNRRTDVAPDYATLDSPIYANGTAERTLLSHVMAGRDSALRAVLQLHPNEFQQSIHREVAVAVHELVAEHGPHEFQQNAPGLTEDYLREHGVARTLEWDSTLPLGDRPQWQFGLHGWADQTVPLTAPGPQRDAEIDALASEIRKNSRAQGLDNISRWSEQALASAERSPMGLSMTDVAEVQSVMLVRTAVLPPDWSKREMVNADIHADPVMTVMPYGQSFTNMQNEKGRSRG